MTSDAAVHGVSKRPGSVRSEEHTSELQSHHDLVCRLLLEKKKKKNKKKIREIKKEKTIKKKSNNNKRNYIHQKQREEHTETTKQRELGSDSVVHTPESRHT